MPQSSDELRREFMTDTDDGIGRCEQLIRDDGGKVVRGRITYAGTNETVLRAVQFLCDEWDYSAE
jgi:hypothetical protein